jgi:hypothetical protein
VAGWTTLVAALVAAAGAMLAERFYYGNDDLFQFTMARDQGLSWTTLTQNVFQHFGPYNRLGHLVVFKFSDLSPSLGLAFVLANYAAVLAAALWLMTELRLSPFRRVLALLLIALSVPMTESAIWFDAGMHVLPAIAVTLAVCAAHVRGISTGARRWHVAAWVLFVLGQLTQERPLFALPLLVLVDLLLLWRHLSWRVRLGRLWQQRAPIAALAVAALGIAAALKTFVVVDTFPTPSWAVTGRTMLSAFSNYVLPSLINQPLADPGGAQTELRVLVGTVVVGLLIAWAGRHNSGPLLLAAAVFLMYYAFLKFSPLLNEETIPNNALRLHNAVYATVPAIIGLAHLRFDRARSALWRARRPAGRPASVLRWAGCLALAAYLVVSNVAYLDRRWADTTESRAYLDAVRASAPEWSDPDVTLIPMLGHPAMASDWSRTYNRHDRMLDFIVKGFAPGDLGPRPVLIDNRGSVRRATLRMVRPDVQVASGRCRSSSAALAERATLRARGTGGGPLFVLLRYRAGNDLMIRPRTQWDGVWFVNEQISKLDEGLHTQLLPLDHQLLDTIRLESLSEGADFCVEEASIVSPLIVEDGGDRCREVDRYGRPGSWLDCP